MLCERSAPSLNPNGAFVPVAQNEHGRPSQRETTCTGPLRVTVCAAQSDTCNPLQSARDKRLGLPFHAQHGISATTQRNIWREF
jgi:hypothetical protein